MNLSFYTAAVGAGQQQTRLNVQSNNIANVNTYGFKAAQASFSSLMNRSLDGIDGEILPQGSGSRLIATDSNLSDGPVFETGRSNDYAIFGAGFFALQDPSNGEISYTRDGSFTLSEFQRPDESGALQSVYMLSDGDGRFVLSQDGTPLEVSDPTSEKNIGVYGFLNTNGLHPVGANRFLPVEKNGMPQLLQNAVVQQGFLEASNTDLAQELSKVIEAQRSYSYALKMVQTSDEVESTINGLRG